MGMRTAIAKIALFTTIPIRHKLTVVMVIATATSVVLSCLGILLSDVLLFRNYLRRDLSALATIIAGNSTAALEFDERQTAVKVLDSLRARPHVVEACIYDAANMLFARYARPDSGAACPAPAAGAGENFTVGDLTLIRPIALRGVRIGTLVLLYDLGEITQRVALYGPIVLGLLIASSFIAFGMSSRLRDGITSPIAELASVAGSVYATRNYSLRAKKVSNDELGTLVDSFNEMLAVIEYRDEELQRALLVREEALLDAGTARDLLHTTLNSIGEGVVSTNLEGRIVFANPAAGSMLLRKQNDLAGNALSEAMPLFCEVGGARLEISALRSGAGQIATGEAALRVRGRPDLPIEYMATAIRSNEGVVYGSVVAFRDLTARRKAEAASRLLAAIVESSDDGIIGQDLTGTITSWNGGAEKIFGYKAEEMIGRHTSLLTSLGKTDEMIELLGRIGKGGCFEQYRASRCTKAKVRIHVSITASPLYDATGRIIGDSRICRDITNEVVAAEKLERLNIDLGRTNDDLEHFAFVASHDLQEPLRMIAVYSQLLIQSYPREHMANGKLYVDNIVEGTKRMKELLADLLSYTEIGCREDLSEEPVDLNTILQRVKQNLKASIDTTRALVETSTLPCVRGREAHFIPLFQNLLSNAIKYRGKAAPHIRVSVNRTEEGSTFAVSDNGIGIDPQFHEKIFVPFKRLHGQAIPGTGIGLAICQRVTERYGGRIWVESVEGRGAKFFFTIPAHLLVEDVNHAS